MEPLVDRRIRSDQENSDFPVPADIIPQLDDIIRRYDETEGALIPVLQSAQNLLGYLPREVLLHIRRTAENPLQ